MATRDVTVTVTMDENDWRLLEYAAECAGMTVQQYLCWSARLLAEQARPGASSRRRWPPARRRPLPAVVDEPEEAAWAESFSERLSHRTDLYRDPASDPDTPS